MSRLNRTNEINVVLQSIKSMFSFLKKYYLVFICFVPIGFLLADYGEMGLKIFLKSVLALDSSYNSEWWYVGFYISSLVAFPFMHLVYKFLYEHYSKDNVVLKMVSMIAAVTVFSYIMLRLGANIIYSLIICEGYVFSEFSIYEHFFRKERTRSRQVFLSLFLLIISVAVRMVFTGSVGTYIVDAVVVAPFILSCVTLLSQSKQTMRFLSWIGKYSTYIWLTHTFFAYYIFQPQFTISRVDILIFIQVFGISLITAIILTKVEGFINSVIQKRSAVTSGTD